MLGGGRSPACFYSVKKGFEKWGSWCLPCSSAPSQELNSLLCCRDGAPYCEKDYQGLFGVKCEACHQFITGKVLEVSGCRQSYCPFPQKSSETQKKLLFHFFFFSIFTSVGRRVVVSDGFLRDLTCRVVSRGSFYSMFTRNWNDGEFTKTDKGTMSYDGEGRVT